MNETTVKCIGSCSALVVATLGAGSVHAQDSTEASAGKAANPVIIVTARKMDENVQDVPIPITAVSEAFLTERGISESSDLSRAAPNLQFDVSGLGGQAATIFMRGVGQANFSATQDPKVGVYVDEVYYARPEGTVFDLFDLNRVEVLRGPQGTLFGRNTAAGLVHFVTNKPQDDFSARVRAGFGNQGQMNIDGMVNLPLGEYTVIRASVQRKRDDGYVLNTATNKRWNDTDSISARLSLNWAPSETFEMRITGDYAHTDTAPSLGKCIWTGPDDGALVSPANTVPFTAFVFGVYDEIADTCNATMPFRSSESGPDENEQEAWGLAGHLKWDLGFAELVSVTSRRETDSLLGSWGLGTDNQGTASYLKVSQTEPTQQKQWSQELRLQGDVLDGRATFVLGAYYFDEKVFSDSQAFFFPGVPVPSMVESPIFYQPSPIPGFPTWGNFAIFVQNALSGHRLNDVHNTSWALFAETTVDLTERLSLTAGARYTDDKRRYSRGTTLVNGTPSTPNPCPDGEALEGGIFCSAELSFDRITPRVILSYDVSDNFMAYSSWSQGYTSGGFNNATNMLSYAPETSDNFEVGLKSQFLDGRVVFNLSGFYNDYRNQQLTVTRLVNSRPEGQILNAQEVTLYGLEVELAAVLANGFELYAQAGFVDGHYDRFDIVDTIASTTPPFTPTAVTRDLSDTEAVPNSNFTYGLTAAYTAEFSGLSELRAQIGWSYRSRQYNTLENLPVSRQDGFGLLDGRVSWTSPNGATTLSLWGTNLLDKQYFLDAADFSSPVSPLYSVTKYFGEPRRFGIEISHSFGGK